MMKLDYKNSRDDGVSESIGFLLIFTIVITGIGLVTLYGYPMLIQQQTGADQQIMEKNMIVLQNDFKSIVYKTVPYKETSLKIGGGSLSVNRNTTTGPAFCVGDNSGCGVGWGYMPNMNTGDLRYLSDASQTEVSLQNGAVVKRDLSNSGSVMLAEPRWFYDRTTSTMVINIVYVNSSAFMSREGIGTVQMELGETDYKLYNPVAGNTVTIVYTPDTGQQYTTAWQTYFEKTLKTLPCNSAGTILTCKTDSSSQPVSTLVIKRTEIIINSI